MIQEFTINLISNNLINKSKKSNYHKVNITKYLKHFIKPYPLFSFTYKIKNSFIKNTSTKQI